MPLVLAAVLFGVALYWSWGDLQLWISWSSDFVTFPLISEAIYRGEAEGSIVSLGTYPGYSQIWTNLLTVELPGHRELWEVWPLAVTTLGVGALAGAVGWVAGRWAALCAAVASWVSGPIMLAQTVPQAHVFTWAAGNLGALAVVVLAGRTRCGLGVWGWLGLLSLASVLGVFTASDRLVIATCVAPLALTYPAVALVRRRAALLRIAVPCIAVALLAVGFAAIVDWAMRAQGYRYQAPPLNLSSPTQWPEAVTLMGRGVLELAGAGPDARQLAGTLPALIGLGLMLAAGSMAVVAVVGACARKRCTTNVNPCPDALVAYLSLTACVLAGALLLTTVGLSVGSYSVRYMVPFAYVVAGLVAVEAARRPRLRAPVAVGVLAYAAVAAAALLGGARELPYADRTVAVRGADLVIHNGPAVLDFVRRRGLRRGYAGYWFANALSWRAEGAAVVRAVVPCSSGGLDTFCGFVFSHVSSWYRPVTTEGGSFLVLDRRLPFSVTGIPKALGRPAAVERVGEVKVAVFDYDIARRFGPSHEWP